MAISYPAAAAGRRNMLIGAVKRVALATGLTLPYVEQGDPSGLPVILLHGYTDSWRSWESVLPYLPDSIYASSLFEGCARGRSASTRLSSVAVGATPASSRNAGW